MSKIQRICELHRTLSARRHPVSLQTLMETLECSEPTAKRAIRELRDLLGAPIEYDRERNGYYYDPGRKPLYELPGLWLSPEEIHALLTTQRLLGGIQQGILEDYIAPMRERLERLLREEPAGHREVERRVRILQSGARRTDLGHFRQIATALIGRRPLRILYHGRARDHTTERIVSPQRLVYYRDNWYLDAWCHLRQGIRSFSVDRVHPLELKDGPAREVPDSDLDAHFTAAYGIFAGPAERQAHLRFSSEAAKWVADEHWHPDQEGWVLADGGYEFLVPYGDPTELLMEILRYGPDVEVLAPESLRDAVAERLGRALDFYRGK